PIEFHNRADSLGELTGGGRTVEWGLADCRKNRLAQLGREYVNDLRKKTPWRQRVETTAEPLHDAAIVERVPEDRCDECVDIQRIGEFDGQEQEAMKQRSTGVGRPEDGTPVVNPRRARFDPIRTRGEKLSQRVCARGAGEKAIGTGEIILPEDRA